MSKLKEKPSALKRDHPALQKMKFIYFVLCLWVIFALLDPDRDCKFGYGSKDPRPIESGFGYRSGSTPLVSRYGTGFDSL
jgi:hypothetical protein